MDHISNLSWIFWNPSREAFTVPYFNLSIAWYGIFFAIGFVIAYFLLIPIVRKKILQNNVLYERDVANWHLLATQIKNQSIFSKNLSIQIIKELQQQSSESTLPEHLKQSLLNSINTTLNDSALNIDRKKIENLFPDAIITAQSLSTEFADQLTWFVVIGTVIGARLGHVLFYDWNYYSTHLIDIIMIRQGGLASHGGTLGIILSLYLFRFWNKKKFPEFTLITIIDSLIIPTLPACFCIRIGNFINQEILGTPTNVPWAVIFGDPADRSAVVPRHPVQLYEAMSYVLIFIILYTLSKKIKNLQPGILSGLFFILSFGFRFFLEFFKSLQGSIVDESFLQMGQYLSIPFILLGIALLVHGLICPRASPIS